MGGKSRVRAQRAQAKTAEIGGLHPTAYQVQKLYCTKKVEKERVRKRDRKDGAGLVKGLSDSQ